MISHSPTEWVLVAASICMEVLTPTTLRRCGVGYEERAISPIPSFESPVAEKSIGVLALGKVCRSETRPSFVICGGPAPHANSFLTAFAFTSSRGWFVGHAISTPRALPCANGNLCTTYSRDYWHFAFIKPARYVAWLNKQRPTRVAVPSTLSYRPIHSKYHWPMTRWYWLSGTALEPKNSTNSSNRLTSRFIASLCSTERAPLIPFANIGTSASGITGLQTLRQK